MGNLTIGTPEETGMDPDRIALIHERASEWVGHPRMRSAVLLVARRGKIVFHEAYGALTHEEDSPPLERDSRFFMSSSTKPVTATAAMMLVEDGLLGLNRPIREYLPSLEGEGIDDVEVQHLFTHTSGFRNDDVGERLIARRAELLNSNIPVEPHQHPYSAMFLECMKDLPVRSQPGAVMDYCGNNYDFLSEIVARVSGEPFDQFVQRRIFDPLGMTQSQFGVDEATRPKLVRRAPGEPAGPIEGDPWAGMEGRWMQEGVWGSGNLMTTALDMGRFAQMYLDGGRLGNAPFISPATHREMTRNQIPGIEATFGSKSIEASWGLGWMIQANHRWRWSDPTLTPTGTYGHGGFGGNYFWIDPVHELVGVSFTVCTEIDMERGEHHGIADLFQNMVTAAVID